MLTNLKPFLILFQIDKLIAAAAACAAALDLLVMLNQSKSVVTEEVYPSYIFVYFLGKRELEKKGIA